MKRVVVTGGAGFIGSAVCRYLVQRKKVSVLNLDKLTYAGVPGSLREIQESPLYRFEQTDVCDNRAVRGLLSEFKPDAVMHLAAESHVDRSIDRAAAFISTNIVGTYNMLECAREYWNGLGAERRADFRFHHVSTDEVYGSLGTEGQFDESTPYDPRSPYSASKAAGDHLVRAWSHTYGLPTLITNCSNNYGPCQFPEKLIPLMILNALDEKPLPVYGKGNQVRDWLYVEDHVRALVTVLEKGRVGRTYNAGGGNERTNLAVVETICDTLDELRPRTAGSHKDLITFVTDRPGHDQRYAVDASRLETELGWKAEENFDAGLRKTIQWYLDNDWWWRPLRDNRYSDRT